MGQCPLGSQETAYKRRHKGTDPRSFPLGPLVPLWPLPAGLAPADVLQLSGKRTEISDAASQGYWRLNIMVVGASATGKSSFINSMASSLSGGRVTVTTVSNGNGHGTLSYAGYPDILRVPGASGTGVRTAYPAKDALATPFKPPIAIYDMLGMDTNMSEAQVRPFRETFKAALEGKLPDLTAIPLGMSWYGANPSRAIHAIAVVHAPGHGLPLALHELKKARDDLALHGHPAVPMHYVITHCDEATHEEIAEAKQELVAEFGCDKDDIREVANFKSIQLQDDPSCVHSNQAFDHLLVLQTLVQSALVVASQIAS